MTYPHVDVYDTTVSVWETGDGGSMDTIAGRIFDPLCQHLERSGWCVGPDPQILAHYPSLDPTHRLASKGEISASVEVTGRVVRIQMWQERCGISSRYEHVDLAVLPPAVRRRFTLETQRVVAFLMGLTGYPLGDRRYLNETADAEIDRRLRSTGHYVEALGRAQCHDDRNRRGADGARLEHGRIAWFMDRKGRICRGRIFYDLNNRWLVRVNAFHVTSVWAHEIWASRPADLRRKRNVSIGVSRLNRLISAAVKAEDFLRAHTLKLARERLLAMKTAAAVAA